MSDQQGTTPSTTAYNARDHLVTIKTREGLKDYYPPAWRLYELTLRYPNANFMSEIVHLDVERDLVIVKCCLYLGSDYSMSEKKTEALKQGRLSTLDKEETAAKACCARDFGISTELALEPGEEEDLEADDIERVGTAETTAAATLAPEPSNGHKPLPVSLDAVKALVWSVYHVSPQQQTPEKWARYKEAVLGSNMADAFLTESDRTRLHEHAKEQQQRQEQQTRHHTTRATSK